MPRVAHVLEPLVAIEVEVAVAVVAVGVGVVVDVVLVFRGVCHRHERIGDDGRRRLRLALALAIVVEAHGEVLGLAGLPNAVGAAVGVERADGLGGVDAGRKLDVVRAGVVLAWIDGMVEVDVLVGVGIAGRGAARDVHDGRGGRSGPALICGHADGNRLRSVKNLSVGAIGGSAAGAIGGSAAGAARVVAVARDHDAGPNRGNNRDAGHSGSDSRPLVSHTWDFLELEHCGSSLY